MINIKMNNVTISGNNVTMLNGVLINGSSTVKAQKFDEKKEVDARNVEKITIGSTIADVKISVSNSSKMEVHFYGEANVDGNIEFNTHMKDRGELEVTVDFKGNCYNGNLKLDVTVPRKTFEAISTLTQSSNITVEEHVSTYYLTLRTKSGNVNTNADFNQVYVQTMSGNVRVHVNAKQNIVTQISTMSGNVVAEFNNIGYIGHLTTSSMSGRVRNYHKARKGYEAEAYISTMSGNITIS